MNMQETIMSIPPNQFRRDHPWTRFVLLDSSAGPVPSQAKAKVLLDFFKDNVNEWVAFACGVLFFGNDGTGPANESNRTKRVQGWSRLNWLGGILIIVSCIFILIIVNAPYARMLLCQLVARFTISLISNQLAAPASLN